MEVYKFLPKVRGGAQRAEGSVVEGKLLYYCLSFCQCVRQTLFSFLFYLLSFIFSLSPIPVATRVSLVMSSNLRRRCHKRR